MRVGVEGMAAGDAGTGVGDRTVAGVGVTVGSNEGVGESIEVGVSVGPTVGVGVAVAVVGGVGVVAGAGWTGFTVMQATVQRVTINSTPASRNKVETPLRMRSSYVVTQQPYPVLDPQGARRSQLPTRCSQQQPHRVT